MEELHRTHKDVPAGWLLAAAAAIRLIVQTLSASPGVQSLEAVTAERLGAPVQAARTRGPGRRTSRRRGAKRPSVDAFLGSGLNNPAAPH